MSSSASRPLIGPSTGRRPWRYGATKRETSTMGSADVAVGDGRPAVTVDHRADAGQHRAAEEGGLVERKVGIAFGIGHTASPAPRPGR